MKTSWSYRRVKLLAMSNYKFYHCNHLKERYSIGYVDETAPTSMPTFFESKDTFKNKVSVLLCV